MSGKFVSDHRTGCHGSGCYLLHCGLMLLSGTSPWQWNSEVVKLSDISRNVEAQRYSSVA